MRSSAQLQKVYKQVQLIEMSSRMRTLQELALRPYDSPSLDIQWSTHIEDIDPG
jgi:hypothetical protein